MKLFESALLVEDEAHLAQTIEIAVSKVVTKVVCVKTISEANQAIEEKIHVFDFVLLDRNLPDGDGLTFCSSLRQKGFLGMILILSAVKETQERVKGLEMGADDYLPKPFSYEELIARMSALARRKPQVQIAKLVGYAGWEIDRQRLRIKKGDAGWVELTPLEFKLATHLMDAKGAIVDRSELLRKVWGFSLLPKTRTVDHFMGRVRKNFELDPENPRHFLTVRGAGYRFEP